MVEKSREMFLKLDKLYNETKWAKFGRGRLTSPVFGGKETDAKKNNFRLLFLALILFDKPAPGEETRKTSNFGIITRPESSTSSTTSLRRHSMSLALLEICCSALIFSKQNCCELVERARGMTCSLRQ
jgi:hypothetical protein